MKAKNPLETTQMSLNSADTWMLRGKCRIPSRKQGGWVAIETVLGIIAGMLMLAGLVYYFNQAFAGSKMTEARSNLTAISTNIRALFQHESNFNVLGTAQASQLLIDLQRVPKNLVNGSTIANEFGGQYTFGSSNGGTTNADQFYVINTSDLPQEACIELAQHSGEWRQVAINGADVGDSSGATLLETQAACVDGDTNLVSFTGIK